MGNMSLEVTQFQSSGAVCNIVTIALHCYLLVTSYIAM